MYSNGLFPAVVVSNELVKRALGESLQMSPMKLQKILYFVYGRYLADTERNKLFNEPISVWMYGPVVESVYYEFKGFGASSITNFATDAQGQAYFPNRECSDTATFFQVLEKTWNKYKNFNANQLVTLTHMKDTPWYIADKENISTIPDGYIYSYFKEHPNE
jgi:uncharacterized phage-associated protein